MTKTHPAQPKKIIGVIGGIGPEASANLYLKMIHYMQTHYNAVQDSDYPPMIIYNVSMQGFDETGIVDGEAVKAQLIDACQRLKRAGADVIIIACNTVHCFYDDMVAAVDVPILNIVEETGKDVKKADCSKIGVLCSQSTNDMRLYNERYLGERPILYCDQAQQDDVNKVIETVMAGRQGPQEVGILNGIIQNMVAQGADGIVLGCTELPLAINQSHTDIRLFDSLNTIIKRAVDFSLGNNA